MPNASKRQKAWQFPTKQLRLQHEQEDYLRRLQFACQRNLCTTLKRVKVFECRKLIRSSKKCMDARKKRKLQEQLEFLQSLNIIEPTIERFFWRLGLAATNDDKQSELERNNRNNEDSHLGINEGKISYNYDQEVLPVKKDENGHLMIDTDQDVDDEEHDDVQNNIVSDEVQNCHEKDTKVLMNTNQDDDQDELESNNMCDESQSSHSNATNDSVHQTETSRTVVVKSEANQNNKDGYLGNNGGQDSHKYDQEVLLVKVDNDGYLMIDTDREDNDDHDDIENNHGSDDVQNCHEKDTKVLMGTDRDDDPDKLESNSTCNDSQSSHSNETNGSVHQIDKSRTVVVKVAANQSNQQNPETSNTINDSVHETSTTTLGAVQQSCAKAQKDWIERFLKHKRMRERFEYWSEQVANYHRWCSNVVDNNNNNNNNLESKHKKRKRDFDNEHVNQKQLVDVDSSVFVQLGKDNESEEKNDLNDTVDEEFLDKPLKKKRKNRLGQRDRRAAAIASGKLKAESLPAAARHKPRRQPKDELKDKLEVTPGDYRHEHKHGSSAKQNRSGPPTRKQNVKEEQDLHPSWQAARQSKSQGIIEFAGKKIKFDND